MSIKDSDISDDGTINYFSNYLKETERKTTITVQDPFVSGSKFVTFNGPIHAGYTGKHLRIYDGTTTINYSGSDTGGSGGGNAGSATSVGVGSDRSPLDLVAEFVTKIDASALNIDAVNSGGTFNPDSGSGTGILKLVPTGGATITVTEHGPVGTSDESIFGSSAGDTVISDVTPTSTTSEIELAPFRYSEKGTPNLRQQTTSLPYKTFIGIQSD